MPVITLISDLGLHDASVGIVKGIIYSSIPKAIVTDISHEVRPFQIAEAAWLLGDVAHRFPHQSVHLVLVDALYQAQPQMLLAQLGGQYVLAPGNGVLSLLAGTAGGQASVVHTGSAGQGLHQWVHTAMQVVARLHNQSSWVPQWPQVAIPVIAAQPAPMVNNTVFCEVQHIDNFGNLITNLSRQQFQELGAGRSFRITVGVEVITRIHEACSDVPKGDALCRFNSRGLLQVCVNKGSAASLLGFRIGGIYNQIKIQFG